MYNGEPLRYSVAADAYALFSDHWNRLEGKRITGDEPPLERANCKGRRLGWLSCFKVVKETTGEEKATGQIQAASIAAAIAIATWFEYEAERIIGNQSEACENDCDSAVLPAFTR